MDTTKLNGLFNSEKLREIIFEIIAKHSTPPVKVSKVKNDTSLIEELGYDSLGFIELIVAVEEKLGVELNEETLLFDNFSTPENLINFIVS